MADLELRSPRPMTPDETSTLCSSLRTHLRLHNTSCAFTAEADAADLLTYACDMIDDGESAGDVLRELEFMEMEICDGGVLEKFREVLGEHLVGLNRKPKRDWREDSYLHNGGTGNRSNSNGNGNSNGNNNGNDTGRGSTRGVEVESRPRGESQPRGESTAQTGEESPPMPPQPKPMSPPSPPPSPPPKPISPPKQREEEAQPEFKKDWRSNNYLLASLEEDKRKEERRRRSNNGSSANGNNGYGGGSPAQQQQQHQQQRGRARDHEEKKPKKDWRANNYLIASLEEEKYLRKSSSMRVEREPQHDDNHRRASERVISNRHHRPSSSFHNGDNGNGNSGANNSNPPEHSFEVALLNSDSHVSVDLSAKTAADKKNQELASLFGRGKKCSLKDRMSMYDENGAIRKDRRMASSSNDTDGIGDISSAANEKSTIADRRRRDLMAVMNDRSLTKQERADRMDEVRAKYGGGGSAAKSKATTAGTTGGRATGIVKKHASFHDRDRERTASSGNGRVSKHASFHDRDHHRHERTASFGSDAAGGVDLSAKAAAGKNAREMASLFGASKRKSLKDRMAMYDGARGGCAANGSYDGAEKEVQKPKEKSVDQLRRDELMAVMKDRSLTKEEKAQRMEEVREKYNGGSGGSGGEGSSGGGAPASTQSRGRSTRGRNSRISQSTPPGESRYGPIPTAPGGGGDNNRGDSPPPAPPLGGVDLSAKSAADKYKREMESLFGSGAGGRGGGSRGARNSMSTNRDSYARQLVKDKVENRTTDVTGGRRSRRASGDSAGDANLRGRNGRRASGDDGNSRGRSNVVAGNRYGGGGAGNARGRSNVVGGNRYGGGDAGSTRGRSSVVGGNRYGGGEGGPPPPMSLDQRRRAELQLVMRDSSLKKDERRIKMDEIKEKYVAIAKQEQESARRAWEETNRGDVGYC